MPEKMQKIARNGRPHSLRLPPVIVALAAFFVVLVIRLSHAEESYSPPKPDEMPAADAAQSNASDMPAKGSASKGGATNSGGAAQGQQKQAQGQGQTFDPAVVSAGQ